MGRRIWIAGGLALLAMASTASAQPQGGGRGFGRGGFGQGAVGLLRMSEVRQELGTTEDQNTKLDELQEQVRSAVGGGNREDFQSLSREEREKRFAEMRTKAEQANKDAESKLASILDAKQVERLNQLRVQREGAAALARPEVATKLGLSAEQKEKINAAQDAGRQQPGANNRDLSDEERRTAFAEMRERREKAEAQALAVLTEEQKAKFAEMKGKEFQFPQQGGRGDGAGRRPRVD